MTLKSDTNNNSLVDKVSRLKKELRDSKKEIEILYKISESISYNLSLRDLLKSVIEMVVDVTTADASFIYLLDDEKSELILWASMNPHPRLIGRIKIEMGEGITGWVAKEKKPVAISKDACNDKRFKFFHNLPEDKFQAFLSVPIISKNEVIGVLNIQHRRQHKYKENEIALVTTIAHQVGGAIENTRLYIEMKKKALQIDTLSQVSSTITSNQYLEEILHLIVTMTAEMMGSKICSIMLLNEEKQELEIKATQSLSEEYRKKSNLKIGESVSGRVVREKNPIAVMDVTTEKGYVYPDMAKREGLTSLLSVPMKTKNRIIGVINSYTTERHLFTKEEIQILQSIANQAAIAIENTTLIEKSMQMEEALEVRKMIEKAKGILMKQNSLSEEEAFRRMQKQSMNMRKSMKAIAEAIILSEEMKNKEKSR